MLKGFKIEIMTAMKYPSCVFRWFGTLFINNYYSVQEYGSVCPQVVPDLSNTQEALR